MNGDLLLVLGLLIACVGLFIVDKPRMDVVALLVIIILPLTGIITMSKDRLGRRSENSGSQWTHRWREMDFEPSVPNGRSRQPLPPSIQAS
jgi:hypothetical protein